MPVNYDYLMSHKRRALKRIYEKPLEKKDALALEEYNNATILPIRKATGGEDVSYLGLGGVVAENGEYAELSKVHVRVDGMYPSQPDFVDKKVVYGGWYVNHWGHFLIDTITRLWCRPQDADGYAFIVDEGRQVDISGNFKRFFELLGLPLEKIILVSKPTKFRQVLVPQCAYSASGYYTREYLSLFDTVRENAMANSAGRQSVDKIFFTRSSLLKARMYELNMKEVDKFFKTNGYRVLAPEKIPLDDMIFYLSTCSVCRAVSGTLPHNMLFAPKGKNLIIVERNISNNWPQVDFNRIKELNVTYVEAMISVLPVDMSVAPVIMGYTDLMDKFAADNGMKRIKSKLKNRLYFRHILKKYLNSYFYLNGVYPTVGSGNDEATKEAYNYNITRYDFLSFRYWFQKKVVQFLNRK